MRERQSEEAATKARLSIQRALRGQLTPNFLSFSFLLDEEAHRLQIHARLDHAPSDDEQENLWAIEGEVHADYPDDFEVKIVTEIGMPDIFDPPGDIVYRRSAKSNM